MNKNALVVVLVFAAGCTIERQGEPTAPPPLDPTRKVSEQICSRAIDTAAGGNLMCREESDAERRARIAEEERQARERREAAERAERERLAAIEAERRRLAEEEAARKRAEEERLAAERRRLEEEAARKAEEERLRREREEARLRAEQEAREAAARECRRLEAERNEGRAMLSNFVATYGQVDEFKEVSGQITAFLGKARKTKPCPPAS